MVSEPCRLRLPVLGSVTVTYETVPGRLPALLSLKEIVPEGAIVGLSPTTVVTSVVLEPAFTGLGDAARDTKGVGN
jgi:hypothetical protein